MTNKETIMSARNNPTGNSDWEWRDLAMQFDAHRMQAIWHIRALLSDPFGNREAAEKFLRTPPLSGEKVLQKRMAEIAAARLNHI